LIRVIFDGFSQLCALPYKDVYSRDSNKCDRRT
jgi:hypothetical protein